MKEISEALGSALIAYLEGEATLLQIESLHEWAGLDPENAELLYGLKHLYAERNATSKIEAVDVETMRHRLLARPEFASEERIAALRPAPRRKLWRKIWFRAVGYAASAAALIAVGVLVGKSGGTVFSDSFNTICVDAGSKSRIVLADGTQVTMKASSKLRYPASFGSGPREVWLDGEAYFDVEHDAEHPFIVHSYRQSVRVLGTTFNVQAYSNESENTVTLLSGAVELDLLSRKGELLRSLELHPYEQCHFDKKAGSYRLSGIGRLRAAGSVGRRDLPLPRPESRADRRAFAELLRRSDSSCRRSCGKDPLYGQFLAHGAARRGVRHPEPRRASAYRTQREYLPYPLTLNPFENYENLYRHVEP